ncbi:hypothetical protein GC170_02750 [bacterium]|nr:hypothetical protein [bacterium]
MSSDPVNSPPSNGLFGPNGFNPSWQAAGNIAFGGMQAVGGVITGIPSVIGILAPEPLTTAAGVAGAAWSADQIQAGSRTVWAGLFGGDAVQSYGSQLLGGGVLGFLYDMGPGGVAVLKKGASLLKSWKAMKASGKLLEDLKAMSPEQLKKFLEDARKNMPPEDFQKILDDLEELGVKPPGVKTTVRPAIVISRDQARAWLKNKYRGLPEEKIDEFLSGMKEPYGLKTLEPGDIIVQYQVDGDIGKWTTSPGVSTQEVGLIPINREPAVFRVDQPMEVLSSTAAEIPAGFFPGSKGSVAGYGGTKGGGPQNFMPPSWTDNATQIPISELPTGAPGIVQSNVIPAGWHASNSSRNESDSGN